jgi:WD40 repeat protein
VKTPPNPYVGPRTFREGETLHGRAQELEELVDLLISERIVLLYSPSGAGKSSLLYAGLVPDMKRRGFHVQPVMRVNNLANLALDAILEKEPNGELLIFDQFEEIVTSDPLNYTAKEQFFKQVGSALRESNRWALFAMREDYLAAIDRYRRWVPTRLSNTYRLDYLSLQSSYEAMREPAKRLGVDFTNEAANQIADDLREVNVPKPGGGTKKELGEYIQPVQLQVVCLRRWQELAEGTTTILPSSQKQLGSAALADYYADTVRDAAKASGIAEREVRKWFDAQLITAIHTRAQVPIGEVVSGDLKNTAIGPLVEAHLVRSDESRGAKWYELAHDRLIEPVLKNNAEWQEANLSLLQREAEQWDDAHRPPDQLLRGASLADAREWAIAHQPLLPREKDFLDASNDAEQRRIQELRQARNLRRLSYGLGIALLGAIVAVGWAWWNRGQALKSLEAANVENMSSLASEGRTAEALGLLAQVLRANPEERDARAWASALLSWVPHAMPIKEIQHSGKITGVTDSEDGTKMIAWTKGGRAQMFDPATGDPVGPSFETPGKATGRWLSPDGLFSIWITEDAHPRVRVIDMLTGAERLDITNPKLGALQDQNDVISATFEPDGDIWIVTAQRITSWAVDLAFGDLAYQPSEPIRFASFSENGQYLAFATKKSVYAYDLSSGSISKIDVTVEKATVSNSGKYAFLDYGDVYIWTPAQHNPAKRLPVSDVTKLGFTHDGNELITISDVRVSRWNTETGKRSGPRWLSMRPLWFANFETGYDHLLEGDEQTVVLRDPHTFEVVSEFILRSQPDEQVFSPASHRGVISTGERLELWRFLGEAPKFKFAEGSTESTPVGSEMSHDLSTEFYCYEDDPDAYAQLRDPKSHRFIGTLRTIETGPFRAAFTQDDRFVAVADSAGHVQVFETSSGRQLGAPLIHPEPVQAIRFSSDGRTLTATSPKAKSTWDLYLGRGKKEDSDAIADLAETVAGLKMAGRNPTPISLSERLHTLEKLQNRAPSLERSVAAAIQQVQSRPNQQ